DPLNQRRDRSSRGKRFLQIEIIEALNVQVITVPGIADPHIVRHDLAGESQAGLVMYCGRARGIVPALGAVGGFRGSDSGLLGDVVARFSRPKLPRSQVYRSVRGT